ncbi:MAG: PIN domain-containing protein [Opitutales bacterium]|nr:PIN domain-containing protein [Opitutales bacterium]
MSVEHFIDTNVFVYSFDDDAGSKRHRARELIVRSLRDRSGAISSQVVQEFLNVALHKWEVPMDTETAARYLQNTLMPLCRIYPSENLFRSALSIRTDTQYRFFDCLIVAAALQSGAKTLYSEDLQHDRRFGTLRIVNPFRTET